MGDELHEIRSRLPPVSRALNVATRTPSRRETAITSSPGQGTRSTGTSADDRRREGQGLVAIGDATSEIMGFLSSRLDAQDARMIQLESRLMGRMDSLETGLISKIQAGAGRILRGKGADGSRGSGRKFSKVYAEYLEDCIKDEEQHVVVPLATWTMIVSAISFAVRTENAKNWLDKDTYAGLFDDLSLLGSESGLSALICSVNGQKRETKEKFRRKDGRLWSYMIRNAIASLFNYSALHLFVMKSPRTGENICKQPGRKGPMAPNWLLELYPRERGLDMVNQVVAKLEKTSDILGTVPDAETSRSVASKKRKLNSEDSSAIHAVKHARKVIVDKLNYGRCSGREYLYNNLLFVMDRICHDYNSFAAARADGYAIDFVEFGFDTEGRRQESPRDILDVSDANTDSLKHARLHSRPPEFGAVDEENISSVEKLIADHPWLSVKLSYKLKVRRSGSARASSRSANIQPELFFSMEEWLPLHSIALGFYLEVFKKEDPKFILSCSQFSIKALHVLAIARRGALRQVQGLDLSDVEKAALGNVEVFAEANDEDDDDGECEVNGDNRGEREGKACLSIVRKISKPGKDRTGYEKLRDSLFQMPWARYVEAQKARDEAERRRTESSMSESVVEPTGDGPEGFDPAAL